MPEVFIKATFADNLAELITSPGSVVMCVPMLSGEIEPMGAALNHLAQLIAQEGIALRSLLQVTEAQGQLSPRTRESLMRQIAAFEVAIQHFDRVRQVIGRAVFAPSKVERGRLQ